MILDILLFLLLVVVIVVASLAWYVRQLHRRLVSDVPDGPAVVAFESGDDRNILARSPFELAGLIRMQTLTSVQVVSAFIERCKRVNPRINALVAARFDEALKEAESADAAVRGYALQRFPPLFGVPITVKESFAVKGDICIILLVCSCRLSNVVVSL